MRTLIDRDGFEVNCGTVLRILCRGSWQWARYERDRFGVGYFVLSEQFCASLDHVDEVDWTSAESGKARYYPR